MKGCLIAVAIVFVLVLGSGLLIWSKKDAIIEGVSSAFEVPEYGTEEHIRREYGELLQSIDTAAANSISIYSFGAEVEKMSLPPEVLFIGIEKDDEVTDLVRNFNWNGKSQVTMNGYGAGTLSNSEESREVMIYENDGPWEYMDSFMVFIEYTGPVGTGPRQ